ncbi:MAG: hypothetical protein GC190_12850 [Alphaproteobacteria bacterium]|nr:hypothetical protein [Alphaproteobacteria bacterium]
MRMSGWEDFALPLTFVFAVVFALTLHHQISLPTAAPAAIAAEQPVYVMTITAKRLPTDCRGTAARAAACAEQLAGEARVEMREGGTRLADRSAELP